MIPSHMIHNEELFEQKFSALKKIKDKFFSDYFSEKLLNS